VPRRVRLRDAPGRPRGASAEEGATRKVILNAALKTFSVYGFNGASITNIARLHHVSPALIHYYFKTKDQLWRAALDDGIGDVIRDLTATVNDLGEFDTVSRLKFFVRRYIAIVSDRPEVFRLIIRESETPGPRLTWITRRHLNPLYAMWTKLVEAAQAEGKILARVPSYHLSLIIAGASYQYIASRMRMLEVYGIDVSTRELREQHANAVLDILFSGMLTNPAEASR
jgi:TetR/AcrR family transcriptional regulator